MQEAPKINKENINRFLCQNCGANMVFDAKLGKLACPYCAHAEEIVADDSVDERSYEEFLQRGMQNLQPMAQEAMQVSCSSCGAIVNFTPPETATSCGFCGGKIVAQPKAADPLIAPEGVLPFSVPQPQAVTNFNQWLSSLWFAPSALKTMASADKLSSIYIPYWTYDSQTETIYQGARGSVHYATERLQTFKGGRFVRETQRVPKVDWIPVQGRVERFFDDVLVGANKSLPRQILERLEPWDLENLVPYDESYLSGFASEYYQVDLDEGFDQAKHKMDDVIYHDIAIDIGGDEQRIDRFHTQHHQTTYKHCLLPVWSAAFNYEQKTYRFIVNGRSGKVQGERPYSKWKIVLAIFGIIAIIGLLMCLEVTVDPEPTYDPDENTQGL